MNSTRTLMATALLWGCSSQSAAPPPVTEPPAPATTVEVTTGHEIPKEKPPASAEARDVSFPPIARSVDDQGLEMNVVELRQLPTVQIKLVIRSGSADDPQKLIGLSGLVASMLKEGTLRRSSAQIAEAVDYLGAHLWVSNDEENIYINMQALSDQLDEAMGLVAELAQKPKFSDGELKKLKRREKDRLALQSQNPNFLVAREFSRVLYGDHPYANIDTTEEVVNRVKRSDLQKWHRKHFAPNNAFLVVVGDVSEAQVKVSAKKAFKGWRKRKLTETAYPEPPTRERRQVFLVDRPQSVQSVIFVGNLAVARSDQDYIPLMVANQVLGGSAASRLFMDLREKQSLTYGAYSRVYESVKVGPFRAYAAVRNEVTEQAMAAFMKHLDIIVKEAPPSDELGDAKRFLTDRFPLRIDTTAKIANLVADLRVYGFEDSYWESYRTQVAAVSAEQALAAAQKHIKNDKLAIVVVGKAADIKPTLEKYGPVTVMDVNGQVLVPAANEAKTAAAPSAPAPQAPAVAPAKGN